MEFAMNDLGEAAEDEEDFNQLNDETFGELTHYDDFPYEYDESRQDYDAIFSDDLEEKIKLNLSYLVLDDDEDPLNEKMDGFTPKNNKTSEWSNNMLTGLDIWGSPAEANNLSLYKNYSSFQKEQNNLENAIKETPPKSIMTLEELEKQLLGQTNKYPNSKNFSKITNTQNCDGLILDNKGLSVQEIERLFLTNKKKEGKENQPNIIPNSQYSHSDFDVVPKKMEGKGNQPNIIPNSQYRNLDLKVLPNMNGGAHISNNNVSVTNMNMNMKMGRNLYNQVGTGPQNDTSNQMMGSLPRIPLIPGPYYQQITNLNMATQIQPHLLQGMIHQRMNTPFHRFPYNGIQPNLPPQHNLNFYTHPNLHNMPRPQNPNHQSTYRMPRTMTNHMQIRHVNEQWEEGISGNHGDEYAGLMTETEKNWLIKIQLMQLYTNNPQIDDYYYTTFMLKKKLKLHEEKNEVLSGGNIEVIMPQFAKPENKPYEPVKYEGALGRLTASSLSAPRQIIDVLTPTNEEVPRTDVKKLKLTLIKIEKKYDLILMIEDQEKLALGLPLQQREEVLKERSIKLNNLICEIVDTDEEFISFLNIRKGILLICRILPLAQKPKNIQVLLKLMGRLSNICKKEHNIEIISNIIRSITFCFKNLLPEDLIIVGQNFASIFQNVLFINMNFYYQKLILIGILALISFIEKLISLDQLSYNHIISNNQWQECMSIITGKLISLEEIHLNRLQNTKSFGISSTTFNPQLILSHLQKIPKNTEDFKLIETVIRLLIKILT